jgi:hypothetical protein
LVLDDLHVADLPSLALLEFVARGLRGTPMLTVGTYRDANARLSPEVFRLLASIEREGQRFPLRRLRPGEVAELIAAQTGSPPDEQTIAAVVRATEGTPLFVTTDLLDEVVAKVSRKLGHAGTAVTVGHYLDGDVLGQLRRLLARSQRGPTDSETAKA